MHLSTKSASLLFLTVFMAFQPSHLAAAAPGILARTGAFIATALAAVPGTPASQRFTQFSTRLGRAATAASNAPGAIATHWDMTVAPVAFGAGMFSWLRNKLDKQTTPEWLALERMQIFHGKHRAATILTSFEAPQDAEIANLVQNPEKLKAKVKTENKRLALAAGIATAGAWCLAWPILSQ